MIPANVVQEQQGELEAHPLYPAGILAARMAGRMGHFALISAALRAGYRPVEQYSVVSIQQTAVTQPEPPKVELGGSASGQLAVTLRNQS